MIRLPKLRSNQRGVTLVELLLVMGMLSIFLGIMATIFTATVDTQSQTQGYSSTISDGRLIMARLNYDIARASAISTPSALGGSSTSLVLTINSSSYSYTLSGNRLRLTDSTGSAYLNDYNATVSNLTFQRIGNSGGKDTIRYSFKLTATAKQGSGAQTQTFTSTQSLRYGGAGAVSNWYNASYAYRQPITLDHTKVSGGSDLTSFPVLIATTQTELKTVGNGGHVQNSNGYDIFFTEGDGLTPLDYDIESYDGATGQLTAWVRLPTLSAATDTSIYMYYDNGTVASSQADANATWSSDYSAVWHLAEAGNATAGEYTDSTINANHGQGGNGDTGKVPSRVTGQIGFGQNLNGSQLIYVPSATSMPALDSTAQTFSWWYEVGTNPTSKQNIFSLIGSSVANQAILNNGVLQMAQWGGGTTVSATIPSAGSWHFITWTNDGGTNTLYVDGVPVATSTAAPQSGAPSYAIFGSYNTTPSEAYVGNVDEMEISTVARTPGWIATQYSNQNAPGAFAAFGVAEAQP